MNERYIEILRELSKEDLTPSKLAKKLGWSRQLAHHYLKKLEERGIVEKNEKGVYRLKERYRRILFLSEDAQEMKVEDILKPVKAIVDPCVRDGKCSLLDTVGSNVIWYLVHSFTALTLLGIERVSLEADRDQFDESLDALWRNELKPIAKYLANLYLTVDDEDFATFNTIFHIFHYQMLIDAYVLHPVLSGSRKPSDK